MERGEISDALQQVTLQRISYENYRCYYMIFNDSVQFCAGVLSGEKGKVKSLLRSNNLIHSALILFE